MPILHADSTLKEIFPLPPVVSFRRPRNIRDLLVNAKLREIPSETQTGSTKCNAKRCSVCPFICESKKFKSSNTGESFPITTHINCKSSWLIYLITCTKCQQQYVGKTSNTLYTRFTGTKSDIKSNKKSLPIVHHFNSNNHSITDVSIMGIESIHTHTERIILKRESYWISRLRTLKPHGINADP